MAASVANSESRSASLTLVIFEFGPVGASMAKTAHGVDAVLGQPAGLAAEAGQVVPARPHAGRPEADRLAVAADEAVAAFAEADEAMLAGRLLIQPAQVEDVLSIERVGHGAEVPGVAGRKVIGAALPRPRGPAARRPPKER